MINLKNRLPPFCLVRSLPTQCFKPKIAHDCVSLEMLKFGCIRARFCREVDECNRTVEISVVVGRNISNEISRMVEANLPTGDI